mmetsp:Transcript_5094/g.14448  ORF Transcript_5094/g.14448 Transcript_5094/m.14448 type:complete len:81 (-) Transcript_5094:331-573(-)
MESSVCLLTFKVLSETLAHPDVPESPRIDPGPPTAQRYNREALRKLNSGDSLRRIEDIIIKSKELSSATISKAFIASSQA